MLRSQYTVRIAHCTPMVDRVLRDMSGADVTSEALFRMFPLQNALTHYELSLGNILETLRVRVGCCARTLVSLLCVAGVVSWCGAFACTAPNFGVMVLPVSVSMITAHVHTLIWRTWNSNHPSLN